MEFTRVDGRQAIPIRLYALSTCGWCKKTKTLLHELGVAYEYLDVDTLDAGEKAQARDDVRHWNPSCSFPTMILDESECIVGFDEAKIRSKIGA